MRAKIRICFWGRSLFFNDVGIFIDWGLLINKARVWRRKGNFAHII